MNTPSVPIFDKEELELLQQTAKHTTKTPPFANRLTLRKIQEMKAGLSRGSEIIHSNRPNNAEIRPAKSDSLISSNNENSQNARKCTKQRRNEQRILDTAVQLILKSFSDPLLTGRYSELFLPPTFQVKDQMQAGNLSIPVLRIPEDNTPRSSPQGIRTSPRLPNKLISKRIDQFTRNRSLSLPPSPKNDESDSARSDKKVDFHAASDRTYDRKPPRKIVSPRILIDAKKGRDRLNQPSNSERDQITGMQDDLKLTKDITVNPHLAALKGVATVLYQKSSDNSYKRKGHFQLKLQGHDNLYWKHSGHRGCSKTALEYILNLFETSVASGHSEFEWKGGLGEGEPSLNICLLDLLEMLTDCPFNHVLIKADNTLRNRVIRLTFDILYGKPIQDARWILRILDKCEQQLAVLSKCINTAQQELIEIIKASRLQNKTLQECDDLFLNFIAKSLGLSSTFGSCNREEIIAHLTSLFNLPNQILVYDGRCVIPFQELMGRIRRSVQQFLFKSQALNFDIVNFINHDDSISEQNRVGILENYQKHQYRACLVQALKKSNLGFENSNENFINGLKYFVIQSRRALVWKNLLTKATEDPYGILLNSLQRPMDWENMASALISFAFTVQKKL